MLEILSFLNLDFNIKLFTYFIFIDILNIKLKFLELDLIYN